MGCLLMEHSIAKWNTYRTARSPGIEKLNRENEIMVFSNPQKIDQAWTGLAHEKIATGPHTSATF
jgi:hypothetical protein